MTSSIEDAGQYFKLVRRPDETRPWVELCYTGYKDVAAFLNLIRNFENAPALIESQKPLLFRGQANAAWTLESKLFRLTKNLGLEEALHRELESLFHFKERAHLFLKAERLPGTDDWFEWLSLMQHFCVPTRFLDWTTSLQVALYFASEDDPPCVDGAVWQFGNADFFSAQGPISDLGDSVIKEIFGDAEKFASFGLSCPPYIQLFDANRKNERMISQRALHIYCWNLFTDHAFGIGSILLREFVPKEKTVKNLLMKFVIPHQYKEQVRRHLHQLNITAASLFPGLDGIGRSITETITYQRAAYRQGEPPQGK